MKLKINLRYLITIFAMLFIFNISYADQNITIKGGTASGLTPIVVTDFPNDTNGIADIIAADLSVTGEFNVSRVSAMPGKMLTGYIITGIVSGNAYTFKVSDVNKGDVLTQGYSFDANTIRKAAHTGSDDIYKQITGTNGIFNTKIAYVIKNGSKYSLVVSDYDGYNQGELLSTDSPLSSISWNKDDSQISYVSYEQNKPVVYVQDLYKTNRYIASNFSGSNSGPAFAGNNRLLVCLSKDYGTHIFVVSNEAYSKSSRVARIVSYGTIDTEPYMGDNGNLVFTSNHDGGPQIFTINTKSSDSTPVRLTMNLGAYNTSAKISHDASKLVFINRSGGTLTTYLMNLTDKSSYPISQGTGVDMAPSFAPNDKLVLFSSNSNMYIVNLFGTKQTRLTNISGEIVDQEWSN